MLCSVCDVLMCVWCRVCNVFYVCVNVLCSEMCVTFLMCVCSLRYNVRDVFDVCVFVLWSVVVYM